MTKKFTFIATLCSVWLSALTRSALAAADIPQMNGLLISSKNNSIMPGLWSLPTEQNGTWQMKIGINPGYATFYAAIEKNEVLYTTRCDAQYGTPVTYVDAYSIETGQNLWSNYPDVSCLPFDLTYNPYDDRIYGLFYNKSNTNSLMLATIEYS